MNYCDLEGKRLALTMRQTPSGLPLSTCIPTDRLTNPFFGRLYRIYVSISLDLDLAHGEGGRGRRRACIAWRDEVWKIINSLFYHDRFLPYTWLSGPSTLIHFLNLLRLITIFLFISLYLSIYLYLPMQMVSATTIEHP